jgi:hypothetical protein
MQVIRSVSLEMSKVQPSRKYRRSNMPNASNGPCLADRATTKLGLTGVNESVSKISLLISIAYAI